jgi:hypothetical protein
MKFAKLLLSIIVISVFIGCAHTVVPTTEVRNSTASYDGNDKNSGIVSTCPGGFVVTDKFLARYDVLAEKYGAKFVPKVKKGDGVTGHVIDSEHMVKFLQMNNWNKAGIAPAR